MKHTVKIFAAAALLAVAAIAAASAQDKPVRVSGKLTALEGNVLTINTKSGDTKVGLTDKAKVLTIGKGTVADIKAGSFIGVGAQPQADGTLKAIRIMIFAESQRGTGEGHRPWDKPGTTMTNATVDTTVKGVDGQVLVVKYKDGEKKVLIVPDTIILLRLDGTRGDLKTGANVDVPAAKTAAGGALETERVDVGRGDFVP
jgi:opacity protein-like surface antigen